MLKAGFALLIDKGKQIHDLLLRMNDLVWWNFHYDYICEKNGTYIHLIIISSGGIYLQGYMVREQSYGAKNSIIELKPPSDEFRTFYLCAENANENKRWGADSCFIYTSSLVLETATPVILHLVHLCQYKRALCECGLGIKSDWLVTASSIWPNNARDCGDILLLYLYTKTSF